MSSVLASNLLSVPVLVFSLGLIGAAIKGELKLPEPVYQAISIFLLFGIGLKGGHSLSGATFSLFFLPAISTILLGALIPAAAFLILGIGKKFSGADRGSIAAHYGSTSLVTFSAALIFLESQAVEVEGFATALLTIMEVPGIIVGIYLGSRYSHQVVAWKNTLIEVLTGKTILLLVGGMAVGFFTNESGYLKVAPFFIDLQPGVLTLFLLHLGFVAGSNWHEVRKVGFIIVTFAIIFPLIAGTAGVVTGNLIGLSTGGATVLGVLAASASYIAAPAAVSLGLPSANGSLALISSIGITFPFNLLVGIPLYLEIAQLLAG
jgi:hypothetical protein